MIKSKLALYHVANAVANSLVDMNNDLVKDGEMPKSLRDSGYIADYMADLYEYDPKEAMQIADVIALLAPSPLKWVDLDPWEI